MPDNTPEVKTWEEFRKKWRMNFNQKEFDDMILEVWASAKAEGRRETLKKVKELASDHYWDSFEKDKDIILKHLKEITYLINKL